MNLDRSVFTVKYQTSALIAVLTSLSFGQHIKASV